MTATPNTTTAARVTRIVQEHLGVDEAPPVANLAIDLQADSLDQIELVMALEAEFGIDLTTTDANTLKTVADLIKLVEGVVG